MAIRVAGRDDGGASHPARIPAAATAEGPSPSTRGPQPGARGTLALAAWFGLAAGLLEVLTKVVCTAVGRSGRLYQMNRNFFWLIPVTNLLVFLSLGLVLAVLVRLWPRFGGRLAVRLLAALAILPSLIVAVPEVYVAAWLVLGLGVAWRLAPQVEHHAAGFCRLVALTFPVLVGAVVALAGWVVGGDWLRQSRESARPLPSPRATNVLLVVLDTVRADRLSVYGYPRKTTPTLEMLASRGVRFDAARSTSPWTLPSHASMFTGRLPHELKADWQAPLGVRFPTLAAYLGSRGYATAGFVANALYCGYDTGLADGFTHYEDYTLQQMDAFLMARLTDRALANLFLVGELARSRWQSQALIPLEGLLRQYVFSGKRKNAAMINAEFLAWLSSRPEPDRPFFAFLNYMDTHDPYLPPSPTDFRFGSPPTSLEDIAVLQDWEWLDKPRLNPRLKTLASDCYDDCLGYLDGQLNALFSNLASRGLVGRTLIIVAADHGESFGEHDLYAHGDSLYRPEIRVPLLIKPPTSRPARGVVPDTVSLRDLPATVVDLLDLAQGSPFPGRSLAGTWSGSGPAPSLAVAELASPNPTDPNQGRSPARRGPLTAIIQGRYAYIHRVDRDELYDEVSDPDDRHDLAPDPAMRPVLDRFRGALKAILPTDPSR